MSLADRCRRSPLLVAALVGLFHLGAARTFGAFALHETQRSTSPDGRFALVLACRSRVLFFVNGEGCVDPELRLVTREGEVREVVQDRGLASESLESVHWLPDRVAFRDLEWQLPR